MLSWLIVCIATASPAQATLKIPFYGVTHTSTVTIAEVTPRSDTPEALMQANQQALGQLGQVVRQVAERDHLDDYGTFELAVAAVDALPIEVEARRDRPHLTVDDAMRVGSWTQTERLFAVGAMLREQGYGAAMLTTGSGIYLGIPSRDAHLNADGLRQTTWSATRGSTNTFWLAWDGTGHIGSLPVTGFSLSFLPDMSTHGEPLSFEDRELPWWTLRREVPYTLKLPDRQQEWTASNRPDAAAYLKHFPSLDFEAQLILARQELALLGLNDELEGLARSQGSEADHIDALLRGYQSSFVYQPGALVSLFDMMSSGRGDCDQLSLLMAASLPDLGYSAQDVKLIRWPGHVALAIRPHSQGPEGGTSVTLDEHRFYLLDLTFYQRRYDGALLSRWGQIPDDRQGTVTIVNLAPVERG